jgi:hypothetical protein
MYYKIIKNKQTEYIINLNEVGINSEYAMYNITKNKPVLEKNNNLLPASKLEIMVELYKRITNIITSNPELGVGLYEKFELYHPKIVSFVNNYFLDTVIENPEIQIKNIPGSLYSILIIKENKQTLNLQYKIKKVKKIKEGYLLYSDKGILLLNLNLNHIKVLKEKKGG